MSPVGSLFRSRKFLLLLLDTFISLVTYFAATYLTEAEATEIATIIGILQPVFVALIIGIAWEDNNRRNNLKSPTLAPDRLGGNRGQ